ncbi:MAG: hypothetical protein ABI667_05830 [Sphingomicrobium sp.]
MSRFILAIAAASIAVPAVANTYTARPASEPSGRIVTRDVMWVSNAGVLTGRTEESRPTIICQGLAKRVGRLDRFDVDGRAFGPADLAKCNAYAKEGAATLADAR